MKFQFIIILGFLLFFVPKSKLAAQSKELTLEDAVLRQRSTFGPKNIPGLQWMHEKGALSFFSEDGLVLMKMDEKLNKIELVNLQELNSTLGLQLKRLPYPEWQNKEEFVFQNACIYYNYNIKTKKGGQILKYSELAENSELHLSSRQIAFTIGKNLYMADESDLKRQISNVDETTAVVCGQSIARSEFGISKGIFWSPKGTLLAFYQKNETDVADYPLLNINVTPGALNSIKYPMAGQKSENPQVGIYNPKTNRTIYLRVSGEKDQYLTNLVWDPSEQFVYVVIVNRAQNHIWFNKYNAIDGQFVKTLFEEEHPKYVEPENAAWFLPNNPKEFLWMSERDGFVHLYHYNTDGKLIDQISSGNWLVKSILGLDESGNNVIVTGTDKSGLNIYTYSVSLKGGKVRRITENEGVHLVSLHPDGSKLLDNYSNLTTPRIISVVDIKHEKETELLKADNPLKDYKIGTVELHTLKGENDLELHARLIKPSNFDPAKKYPVIVYLYGGPHAQMVNNSWLGASQLWMQYQAERGYLIFTLDNRGSENRGFEFENVIHRQLGTNEITDQLTGVNWLKTQSFVDADRLAVHGWSFGGFMTASLMLRTPDVFKVGVAGGTVTDWKYYEIMYGERYMDTPAENPEGYDNSSLMKYAKNLKGDLLLIHGTADDVVLEQHSMSLLKAFIENGVLVDYFPYPMHAHNVFGKDRVHLMKKILTYIEDKLK